MIALPSSVRIYLATGSVDLRKSIDGLGAIVMERGHDLYSGHLYVFLSRRGDRLKILTWSAGGFLVLYKRLERGKFRLPEIREGQIEVQIDATQLAMLLDGIDIKQVAPPRRWTPPRRETRRDPHATPLHRLAKQYQRLGIPMSHSTLTDLFHATAEKLAPLSQRLLRLVGDSEIVQADRAATSSVSRHVVRLHAGAAHGEADGEPHRSFARSARLHSRKSSPPRRVSRVLDRTDTADLATSSSRSRRAHVMHQ